MIWIQIPLKGIQRLIRVLSFNGAVLCIVMDYLFQYLYSSILLGSTWTPPYSFTLSGFTDMDWDNLHGLEFRVD